MTYPTPKDNELHFDGGIMITETDLSGRFTYANRKFLNLNGYERSEIIGQPHNIIYHPDMPEAPFKEMWNSILMGNSWEGYVKNLSKDGSYYWVHLHANPRFDPAGRVNGYIATREVPGAMTLEEIKRSYEIKKHKEAARNNLKRQQSA